MASITGNRLIADDNAVDVRGATNCRITQNLIEAGVAGVGLGDALTNANTQVPGVSSSHNVIAHNLIVGVITYGSLYKPGPVPTVQQAPLDGVIDWYGTGNLIAGNVVRNFVTDIYIGQDPLYRINGATPPTPGTLTGYAAVIGNAIVQSATPASSSAPTNGLANLNNATTLTVRAPFNCWGCYSGPNTDHCTTTAGPVAFLPWAVRFP